MPANEASVTIQPNIAAIKVHPAIASTAALPNGTCTTQPVKASVTTQLKEAAKPNEAVTSPPAKSSNSTPINSPDVKEKDSCTHRLFSVHPDPVPRVPVPSSFHSPSSHPSQKDTVVTRHVPIPTCVPDTGEGGTQPSASDADAEVWNVMMSRHHGDVYFNDKRWSMHMFTCTYI